MQVNHLELPQHCLSAGPQPCGLALNARLQSSSCNDFGGDKHVAEKPISCFDLQDTVSPGQISDDAADYDADDDNDC